MIARGQAATIDLLGMAGLPQGAESRRQSATEESHSECRSPWSKDGVLGAGRASVR